MNSTTVADEVPLAALYDLKTIRRQSQALYARAKAGALPYFALHEERLPAVADFVLDVIRTQYPALDVPYHSRWRHFEVGGVDRIAKLKATLNTHDAHALGAIMYELAIISVLLDAGAGEAWRYVEPDTGVSHTRSEGLAVASLDLYRSGALSRDQDEPLRADASALRALKVEPFSTVFQARGSNALLGVEGRVGLLNQLGRLIEEAPEGFGSEKRLGGFYHYVVSHAEQGKLAASKLFDLVLRVFQPVWPKRLVYQGASLGDVWSHPSLMSSTKGGDLIPFHKLTQWLTYSLVEPLEWAGIEVTGLDALTGLPEYRNGGLFIDMGLIEGVDASIFVTPLRVDSEVIVAWRALTVVLLDKVADAIRTTLGMTPETLPLAKILQGGTWQAGREIARQKRATGGPPIHIVSDGTVF